MIAAAFAFASWHIRKLARQEGIKQDGVFDAAIVAMVAGIVGARIFFVLQPDEWNAHFRQAPLDALKIWEGGLTFYAGLSPVS